MTNRFVGATRCFLLLTLSAACTGEMAGVDGEDASMVPADGGEGDSEVPTDAMADAGGSTPDAASRDAGRDAFVPPSEGWTIIADFEVGESGSPARGERALTGAGSNTVHDDMVVHSGRQAALTSIETGHTGFGEWGGSINFPEHLFEGDEIWFRAYVYFPDGFDFSTDSGMLKTLRIHTKAPGGDSGTNEGYFDVLVSGNLAIGSELGTGHFANNPGWRDSGERVRTAEWHALEMYIRFSSVAGEGIYRVWQNGNLVFEDTRTATLKTSVSESDFIYIFTYWNGGAPSDQHAYLDDIVVTTGRPSAADAAGNPFIGLAVP